MRGISHEISPNHTRLSPSKSDLKCLVTSNERGQPGETLFAGPAHTDQEGVASRRANDPGNLDQMSHGVFEEDEIHASAADAVVILLEEVGQPLL